MLPLHQAVSQLGAPLTKTVIKAHILTGYDCMSRALRHTVPIKMYETIAAECGRNRQVCRQV